MNGNIRFFMHSSLYTLNVIVDEDSIDWFFVRQTLQTSVSVQDNRRSSALILLTQTIAASKDTNILAQYPYLVINWAFFCN